MTRGASVLLAGLALAACGDDVDPTTAEMLANATYLTGASSEGMVTLVGGAFDFPPGGEIGRIEYIASAQGDFDGDEDLDAAVVVAEYADMETYYRLHALLAEDGKAVDVAERLLGDRVSIESIRLADGVAEVDMLIRPQGSNPQTEPSVPITVKFALTGRGLQPINPPTPKPGGATTMGAGATASLPSHEWVLQTIEMGDWSQTVDDLERRPSLRFAVELGDETAGSGRISGYAGCNQIFASYVSRADGGLSVSGIGATRRTCSGGSMDVEDRVIASLGTAVSYEIEDDRLVIAFNGGVMRFSAGAELERPEIPGSATPRGERDATEPPEGGSPRRETR